MKLCFMYPNLDLILFLGFLFCLFLLVAVTAYFAVEAVRSHSKIIHAYWVGKSEGLEQVINTLKEKSKSEPFSSTKEELKKEKPLEVMNACRDLWSL